MSWKMREECLQSRRESLTTSDASEWYKKMKIKGKRLLDLTACGLEVMLAEAQLKERWEQSGEWSGLWREDEK